MAIARLSAPLVAALVLTFAAGCGARPQGNHGGTAIFSRTCDEPTPPEYLQTGARLTGPDWTIANSHQVDLSATGYIVYVVQFRSGKIATWAAHLPVGPRSTFITLDGVAALASHEAQADPATLRKILGGASVASFDDCLT